MYNLNQSIIVQNINIIHQPLSNPKLPWDASFIRFLLATAIFDTWGCPKVQAMLNIFPYHVDHYMFIFTWLQSLWYQIKCLWTYQSVITSLWLTDALTFGNRDLWIAGQVSLPVSFSIARNIEKPITLDLLQFWIGICFVERVFICLPISCSCFHKLDPCQ